LAATSAESDDARVIRRIRADDVTAYREVRLRALHEDPSAFGSTYDEEHVKPESWWVERTAASAAGEERSVFLAFDDISCVGLAGGYRGDQAAERELFSMWVAPSHRGTGIANDLVGAVLTWAEGSGALCVGLWVTRGNDRAQRLYERLGFTVTGDVQPLPSDPCKDEIRMMRPLLSSSR
jgi:RimJ/RimL family protein N-acetyltransferase